MIRKSRKNKYSIRKRYLNELKNQTIPIEFCQKSKEKIIVVKQRKPRHKKEIVV
jgi:hypothetical protein